jgi:DNA-binding MarR family transcriptional regulator
MIPETRASPSSIPTLPKGSAVPAADVAALRAHSRFPEAMRLFAEGIVAVFRGNRLINLLTSDRGRMLIGFLALYLNDDGAPDGRGRGFSVTQMKAAAAEAGVASPGRTGAMLALMRATGYLTSASDVADRRRHVLLPTEQLRAAYRERWARIVRAMRPVLPEAAAVVELGNPEFEAAYVRSSAGYFIGGMRLTELAPELDLLIDRNAGLVIMFDILVAADPAGRFPSLQPVAISISALARRFGVSRAHIRKLLHDAEAAGFIDRSADGQRVALRPLLAGAFERFFAFSLLFVAKCVLQAHAETRMPAAGPAQTLQPHTSGAASSH